MSTDRKHQAPAMTPGPTHRMHHAHPGHPAEEDEYAAVAAGEPEGPEPQSEFATDDDVAATIEALTAKAEKADEYLELAKRTKADFENYRKRAMREAAAAQ